MSGPHTGPGYGRGGRGAAVLVALNEPVRQPGQASPPRQDSAPVVPGGRDAMLHHLQQQQGPSQQAVGRKSAICVVPQQLVGAGRGAMPFMGQTGKIKLPGSNKNYTTSTNTTSETLWAPNKIRVPRRSRSGCGRGKGEDVIQPNPKLPKIVHPGRGRGFGVSAQEEEIPIRCEEMSPEEIPMQCEEMAPASPACPSQSDVPMPEPVSNIQF